MVPSNNNNSSIIGGYPNGSRHIPKKSMIHDERVLKVASVYAMDSLSPVLKRQAAQYQKMRDLSQGPNINRNS